ncbi:MAG: Cation efflux system protein CusA [Chlamydiae bacterium]|nr:Cation efflux system protein CusA [Chlamydiota bacterium]
MTEPNSSWLGRIIRFCLEQKLVIFLVTLLIVAWGIAVAPFDWKLGNYPRDPVGVDAIPDISDNLQIVFTEWTGRSPQDVEDQITYPLTTALLGIPGVNTIRSYSFFGFSTINIIFNDDIDFYWSRSRILEKLNSLPNGTLPEDVQPAIGPDATALGQIFWYTLEGHDPEGNVTGGWDLEELRTIQDWYVRYALLSAGGVSDVAGIGGYVKAYYVDVDPDALRAYKVSIEDVFKAVKMSNLDVGARTIEINQVEYFIRGLGFIKNLKDVEEAVIKTQDNLPVRVKDVAVVSFGPFIRRGALNKEGAEVVGGIVIARYGENSLQVIKNVKEKIKDISTGLPAKILPNGTESKVTVVPYYDRTGLIYETLGTLDTALSQEILVTIIVVLVGVMHLRSSLLISIMLPLSVLITFIIMKFFKVEANIVSLSGIAIAIGAIVSMGIFICENILKLTQEAPKEANRLNLIYKATTEVGSAVLTAAATTIVSFLPVFTMIGPEGRLFKPLAFTKTFVLVASIFTALLILPPLAQVLFMKKEEYKRWPKLLRITLSLILFLAGIPLFIWVKWWVGVGIAILGIYAYLAPQIPEKRRKSISRMANIIILVLLGIILTRYWLPLGPEKGFVRNIIFVGVLIGGFLLFFRFFQRVYPFILKWSLNNKGLALIFPVFVTALGVLGWLGIPKMTEIFPPWIKSSSVVKSLAQVFPGLGKEFMPPLDEGSYLYMPITMAHAGTGEVEEILKFQNMAFTAIPEVRDVVGKWGRAETPIDPAPISMFETVINYYPKYLEDVSGHRIRFKYDPTEIDYFRTENGEPVLAPDEKPYYVRGKFERNKEGGLIPNKNGIPFRLWRLPLNPNINNGRTAWKGVNSSEDIWKEIEYAGQLTGVTTSPKLQPIAARIVMLQSGMRAPMGIKVKGPDLETIEDFGIKLEKYLKEIPSIYEPAVIADRIVGKPYLEIEVDREEAARYGLMINEVQDTIEIALGGKITTTTVEGRERFPVRVRYLRERRDNIEEMNRILFNSPSGEQIPLTQIAKIKYVRGPQVIKSEDTFLIGYVLFDKLPQYAEVDVIEQAQKYLNEKIEQGKLVIPAGVSFSFSGTYENQIRAQKKLAVILPLALFIILLILYFQFKSFLTSFVVFSGIIVAWSGGFIFMWLYGESWFLNFDIFGVSMRDLFQIHPINLSVAVWVGFLALFGIATDNGVILATSIDQIDKETKPNSIEGIREAVLKGSIRRIRPVIMTSATTILALLPILTSTGRGSDVMVPMAIPSFGGMIVAILSVIIVPMLCCWIKELKLKMANKTASDQS